MNRTSKERLRAIGQRLRAERIRLGFKQNEMAVLARSSLASVQRWENETPIPADKLAALSDIGMDVQFVLTGVRSTNLNAIAEVAEDELVRWHAALPEDEQRRALALIKALASTAGVSPGGIHVEGDYNVVAAGSLIKERGKKRK